MVPAVSQSPRSLARVDSASPRTVDITINLLVNFDPRGLALSGFLEVRKVIYISRGRSHTPGLPAPDCVAPLFLRGKSQRAREPEKQRDVEREREREREREGSTGNYVHSSRFE